jgi:hypothetical protein
VKYGTAISIFRCNTRFQERICRMGVKCDQFKKEGGLYLDLIITSLTESVVMTEGDFAHSILPPDKTGTNVGCHPSYLRGEQK